MNSIFNNYFKRSYVTFLRFFSLSLKFLFILYLTKNISVELFGEFGFLTSFIFFVSLIIGFESGTLESRRILDCNNINDESKLYFGLFFDTFLMWIFISAILFLLDLDIKNSILFMVLLISLFESLNAELKKILISKNLNLFSCYIDLIRVSLWPIFFIFFTFLFNSNYIEFNLIFLFYLIATFLSFLLILLKLKPIFKVEYLKLSFSFFKNKIKILPFFLYGFILLFYEVVGRFILKYYGLYFDLGIYTFYSSLIFSISLFIWSFNVSFEHRDILNLFKIQSYNKAYIKLFKLIKKSLFLYLLISISIFIFIKLLLFFLNLFEYEISLYSLILFFIIPLLNILDTQFNYFLYGHKLDFAIGLISLTSLLIFSILFYFYNVYSFINVLELINFSFFISLIIKISLSIFLKNKNANN